MSAIHAEADVISRAIEASPLVPVMLAQDLTFAVVVRSATGS
jgi:hypothetical protein